MRSLFNTHSEGFYIETSTVSLIHILQGRRLMYYWTILQKKEVKVNFSSRYFLLNRSPQLVTGPDWVRQVKQDLVECEMFHTQQEFKTMSRYKFKSLVDKCIK